MKEFIYVLKNMFNFKGRSRRRDFWISQAINYGFIYIVGALMTMLMGGCFKGLMEENPTSIAGFIVFAIVMVFVGIWSFLFSLAVTIRRLHDRGMSGWILLACILGAMCCGIGNIVLFVLLCLDGQEGENQYGPNPKENSEPTTGGSIATAIIVPIAGFIFFMIGYFVLLVNMANAVGGWENLFSDQPNYEYSVVEDDDDEDLTSDTEEKTTEEETTEELSEDITTEATEAPKDDSTVSGDAPENVVSGTSLTSPAAIGDWLPTTFYSTVDSTHHPAYYRITDVVAGEEVEQAITDYNSNGYSTIEPLDKEDLEYRLIKFEVYIPNDFPTEEWGLTSVNMHFDITDEDEGGIEYNGTSYIGLTSHDISRDLETSELMPGGTFKDGKAIMVMVKGCDDYLIEHYYEDMNEEGNFISEYTKGK